MDLKVGDKDHPGQLLFGAAAAILAAADCFSQETFRSTNASDWHITHQRMPTKNVLLPGGRL